MRTIRVEVEYPHPPAKVWRAIADPQALADWFMENNFEPRLGHKFEFRMKPQPGFNGIIPCEVVEIEEPRRLVYTWGGGAKPDVVSWTLQETPEGTRLLMEHTGLRGLKGFLLSRMMSSGWNRKLRTKIPNLLDRMTDSGFTPAPREPAGH